MHGGNGFYGGPSAGMTASFAHGRVDSGSPRFPFDRNDTEDFSDGPHNPPHAHGHTDTHATSAFYGLYSSPLRRATPSAAPTVLSFDNAENRGMSAWYAELLRPCTPSQGRGGDPTALSHLAMAVEGEGDAQFARARAPLFERARQPHAFTPEERKRMDRYESIDYGEPQSFLYKARLAAVAGRGSGRRRGLMRWAMFVAVGVVVGLWAVLLFQTLDYLSEAKLELVQGYIRVRQAQHERHHQEREKPSSSFSSPPFSVWSFADRLLSGPGMVSPNAVLSAYGVFVSWSVVAAMLSSLCCVVMPSAAGSGIPDVMAYLNGIMFPRIFNVRNLVTKTLSCILAVSAGLPVGTEGPIIHIGSLIGAGLPTGRSRSLRCGGGRASLFHVLRNAKDERDFISAGAACGLTSAFSSPLGGMLFVLEEIATFFPVRLAWMVLVSCLSCMCVTQYVNTHLSGWHVVAGRASVPAGNFRDSAIAMFYLGTVPENSQPMNALTFVATVVVAVLAGLLAVLYTVNSIRLSRWRARRLFPKPVLRVLEPGVFAFFFATACYFLPLLLSGCQTVPAGLAANAEKLHVELVTAFCKSPSSPEPSTSEVSEEWYHALATLSLTNPYNLLRLLFSRRTQGLFPASALLAHLLLYTAGSSYAGGMFISCGTVIPSLLIGAMTGRLVGEIVQQSAWADPGVLALVGSAAYFSGISRLTFSLIVIMMELTADLTHVPCLMLAAFVAKGVADRYCHSLYASTLEVKAAPLLEVQTDIHRYDTCCARDIASAPVTTLGLTETAVHVLEILHATTHNAFPVVSPVSGTYVGIVTRAQLQLLLWVLYFREEAHEEATSATTTAGEAGRGAAVSLAELRERRARWLREQRHATDEELRAAKETVFWDLLPAMVPPGQLPVDVGQSFLDLSPYVDLSPHYVLETTCVSRTYYLFRHLGLRHLPVLDRHMRVVGVLTRVNFVGERLQEKVACATGFAGGPQRATNGHLFFSNPG